MTQPPLLALQLTEGAIDVIRQIVREELAAAIARAKAERQAGGAPPPAPPPATGAAPYSPPAATCSRVRPDEVTVCLGCGREKTRSCYSEDGWRRGICGDCDARHHSLSPRPVGDAAPGAGEPQTPEWAAVRDLIPQLTWDAARYAPPVLREMLADAIRRSDHMEIDTIRGEVDALKREASNR